MPAPASPEDPRLAELRRQREFIARHLAWLDSEIAHASDQPPPPAPPPAPLLSPPSQPLVYQPPPPPAPVTAPEISPAIEALLPEPASGLNAREKYGCIAILIVLALLAIGTLFGLPYLIPSFR